MSDDRWRVTVPDELAERIEAHFGHGSTTDSGTIVTALWFACERYEAEHGIDWESQTAQDEVAEDE